MLVTFSFRITVLYLTYGSPALSALYVGYLKFKIHLLTRQIWVYNLNCSLCFYVLPTESLGHTTLIGV